MTRFRYLTILAILVLPLAYPVTAPREARAAGTVSVTAWTCQGTVDPAGTDPAAFAAACTEKTDGATFALTAGGVTRNRATAAGRPASWPLVSGDFTLALQDPKGEPAVVFCGASEGTPQRFDAPAGEIKSTVAGDDDYVCQWYRLPATTAQPTPTATTQPPATSPTATRFPTATATLAATATPTPSPTPTTPPTAASSPTATQFPTPDKSATPAATATPTPPPLPDLIDTGPPQQFRGDAAHTGQLVDPGPAGDPALLWRSPLDGRPNSSPAVAAGVIYVGDDSGVLAIDALTGTERWRFPTKQPVTASPAVVDGVVYVGGVDGVFYAIDAGTGVERWRFETGGKIRSSAAVADGAVYFASYDGNVYALDAATGEERWRHTDTGDVLTSSPAVSGDTLVIGTSDLDGGLLLALSTEDGDVVWDFRVTGAIVSSPAIGDGVVYAGSDDGFLYAVDLSTGEVACSADTKGIIRSSPAVSDGGVVIGNRSSRILALDPETCEQRWRFDAGDRVDSSPSVTGDTVFVGSSDGNLYALDGENGEERWHFTIGGGIVTSPTAAGDAVYVASRNGFLYALVGSDSPDLKAISDVARPADVPAELILGGVRYRFDRPIPPDLAGLEQIGMDGPIKIYGRKDQEASAPIYADRPGREQAYLARYLPEQIEGAAPDCRGDHPTVTAQLVLDDTTYVFAGSETDLQKEAMNQIVESSRIGAIYTPSRNPPAEEVFVDATDGFQRFVRLDADGLPAHLRGPIPFAGGVFSFAGDVTDSVSEDDLVSVGCNGPFAMKTEADASDPPYAHLYVTIADRVLAFDPVEPT